MMDNVNVIRTGFIAPDFRLPSTDGSMVSLKECLSSDFLVLCFFSGSEDARTRSILTDLNAGLPPTDAGYRFSLLAVSPEKIHRLSNFKKSLGLTFPILSDEKMTVCRQYYVIDTGSRNPAVHFSVFVIDDEFIVRYKFSESLDSEFQVEDFRKNISTII
jgi:peroxiredoxin